MFRSQSRPSFIASLLSLTLTSLVSSAAPLEIVLVESKAVTVEAVPNWKKEGFKAVAVILDERAIATALTEVSRRVAENGLDLYYWIEVGQNREMAAKNPKLMAALGSHSDWQKNFPKFPEPGIGEIAKAFPWVPIGYKENFDAHLARIDRMLKRLPEGWRGVLLNDLQAGPSSCGCGNLQCRWAIDYFVTPTTVKLEGNDVAARFVAEVRKRTAGKAVIPVWTTECSDVDLPSDKNGGRPGTGFCGTVGCSHSACAEVFSAQWSALTSMNEGPTALLATHTALNRTQPEFGGGPGWLTNAIAYVNQTLPAHGGKPVRADQLWVVVEGMESANETRAREIAAKAGVGGLISARVRIDQTYEPRMIRTK